MIKGKGHHLQSDTIRIKWFSVITSKGRHLVIKSDGHYCCIQLLVGKGHHLLFRVVVNIIQAGAIYL